MFHSAEQMDVHEGTATVREALRFSAYLRQPFSVPESEKDAYVEEIIDLLELHTLADALVLSLNTEGNDLFHVCGESKLPDQRGNVLRSVSNWQASPNCCCKLRQAYNFRLLIFTGS
jgi:hypothetical protein